MIFSVSQLPKILTHKALTIFHTTWYAKRAEKRFLITSPVGQSTRRHQSIPAYEPPKLVSFNHRKLEDIMPEKPESPLPEGENERSVSRRELLKILGAAGGTLTASVLLPEKWLPPQLDIGVLPAHAQTSEALTISNLRVDPNTAGFLGNMMYFDPMRKTGLNTSQVLGYLCDDDYPTTLISINPAFAISGHVLFNFATPGYCMNTTFVARLQTDGRISNELFAQLPDG
jgi:hypothetical protein